MFVRRSSVGNVEQPKNIINVLAMGFQVQITLGWLIRLHPSTQCRL